MTLLSIRNLYAILVSTGIPFLAVSAYAQPVAVIIDVEINGQHYTTQQDLIIEGTNNLVAISFGVPWFAMSDDVYFRYRLEGYDASWRLAASSDRIRYRKLPRGYYRFVVEAGTHGTWSGMQAHVELTRVPTFRETRVFLGVLLLCLLLASLGVYKLRLHRLKIRNRRLSMAVEVRTRALKEQRDQLAGQAAQLQHAIGARKRLLADISHELRTPLALTLAPLRDFTNGRYKHIEDAQADIELAERSGRRLLTIVDQLLDLSRLEAGVLQLHLKKLDLVAFLKQQMALFQTVAYDQGVALFFEAQVPEILHVTDPHHLETIASNLITNALKHTPEGGCVTINLREEGGYVIWTIRDTGHGIPPEHLPYLFDRFFRVHREGCKHPGSGIGLALSKQLVEMLNGTICVRSTEEEGTTFTIVLPALEYPDSDMTTSELPDRDFSNGRPDAYDGTRVLIVDDHPDMLTYLSDRLQEHYTIETARNGDEALAIARTHIPDIIISDVVMPMRCGISMLEQLRKDSRTSHIPVILLSARSAVQQRIAGLESGADAYLAKPFHGAELDATIRRLLDRRETARRFYTMPEKPQPSPEISDREVTFLDMVREEVIVHLGDSWFGVDDLADAVAMSRRQFQRKLAALTSETPAEFIRRIRMEHAARLVAERVLSIKEIAAEVGYKSSSHFTQVFKETYGVSPGAYILDV